MVIKSINYTAQILHYNDVQDGNEMEMTTHDQMVEKISFQDFRCSIWRPIYELSVYPMSFQTLYDFFFRTSQHL